MAAKPIRQIRIEGQIAYVTLTKGHTAVIDAADADFVGIFNWWAQEMPHAVYAARTTPRGEGKKKIFLHRYLMRPPEGMDVDHIDGDGMNNRRSNLRVATRHENACNQKIRAANTSGFKGVSFEKFTGRWAASICSNNKYKRIGRFDTVDEAGAAYAEWSRSLHGRFGRIR